MSEAVLIEIAQRFRKLEDANEETDSHLVARQEKLRERIGALEAKHAAGTITYNAWCRESATSESEHDKIAQARTDLEKCLEACREDMVSMQEQIRKAIL